MAVVQHYWQTEGNAVPVITEADMSIADITGMETLLPRPRQTQAPRAHQKHLQHWNTPLTYNVFKVCWQATSKRIDAILQEQNMFEGLWHTVRLEKVLEERKQNAVDFRLARLFIKQHHSDTSHGVQLWYHKLCAEMIWVFVWVIYYTVNLHMLNAYLAGITGSVTLY